MFLTTHDIHTAGELCDRVAFIVDGALAVIDAPRALMLKHGSRKVAVAKAGGILLMAPIAIPFLDPPFQYLAGISPTFWVSKAVLSAAANESELWWIAPLGGVVTVLYIALLRRRFIRQAE